MRIVVLGWYHHQNLGDDLFQEAFHKLFPEHSFTFVDRLQATDVREAKAVFIGGGSLLDGAPPIDDEVWPLLDSKPICYIGVGSETRIHPAHMRLLRKAKLIALRNDLGIDQFREFGRQIRIPDLVYSVARTRQSNASSREGVLVLPNVSVMPTAGDPHWKYAAWDYFKSEMSQFLDDIVADGTTVTFFSMSKNDTLHDDFAAMEILGQMKNRKRQLLPPFRIADAKTAEVFVRRFRMVVTQRYHGLVLADLAGTPAVVIAHHDKLSRAGSVSYWGITKSSLHRAYHEARVIAPPPMTEFTPLQTAVEEILRACHVT